jgi:hypothetical protein
MEVCLADHFSRKTQKPSQFKAKIRKPLDMIFFQPPLVLVHSGQSMFSVSLSTKTGDNSCKNPVIICQEKKGGSFLILSLKLLWV